MNTNIRDIDEYIAAFPEGLRLKLETIREEIRKTVPEAQEAIKYAMPTFVLEGNLVHFAGYKNHIGFYPAPEGILAFEKELGPYKRSKGAIQFPLDEPLPLKLISKIVKFRAAQNLEKAMGLRPEKRMKKPGKE